MTLKKEIIKKLSNKLSLPFLGIEQDWCIEMANPERIDEFLIYYNQNDLVNDEKIALMSLIIASYDEFLNKYNLEFDDKWSDIKKILNLKNMLFRDLMNYWSSNNEHDIFRITPLIRDIKSSDGPIRPIS